MKKIFILFFALITNAVSAFASVEINGIAYNLNKSDQTAEVTSKTEKYTGEVVIPESITLNDTVYTVTSIGFSAFYWCEGMTSIILPNSLTAINNQAFLGCTGLTSISITPNVKRIMTSAFHSCRGLTSIVIPGSVIQVESSAFADCTSLMSIVVEESNPNYSSRNGILFNKDKSVIYKYPAGKQETGYAIPDSVTIIGGDAFSYCKNLTSITIPGSVTLVNFSAFDHCTGLTSIIVEESNPNYSSLNGDLYNKDKTTLVYYPLGKQDTEYIVSDGVTSIGSYAFHSCTRLKSVTLPNSVTSIGGQAFMGCTGLISINIPDDVTNIGNSAFSSCRALASINIPSKMTTISGAAFSDCAKLTSITIPKSVENIEYQAFNICSGLKSITCEAVNPPSMGYGVFNGVGKSIPLYVPLESIEAYKAADQWKDFSNILPIADFDPEDPINPGSYKLTLVVENSNQGYTTGSGLYEQGAKAHIEAVANKGYQFVRWSDNDSNAVRDIVITRDSTLTAYFSDYLGDDTVYVYYKNGNLDELPIGKNSNVIVTSNGRLNISRPITIKSLLIEKDTAFGQVSGVDMLKAENIEVKHYFYKTIDEGSYRWFAFSVPFKVSVANGIFKNERHDVAYYGVDYVINEYNGNLRATTQDGWRRLPANATLYPGKLYMIASKQANTWYFKAEYPSWAFIDGSSVYVDAWPSTIGDHHAGWNGIANKLCVNANIQASDIQYATIYDNYYGIYRVMELNNYITQRPSMPFFVQAPQHDTIKFVAKSESWLNGEPIGPDAGTPNRLRRANNSKPLMLGIGNSEYTDNAFIDMESDKEDRYTIGEDLVKMQTSKPTVPQIWVNAYDARLAAYALPAESEKSSIQLGMSAPKEGVYTISLNELPQGVTMFISKDGEHLYQLSGGEYEIYLEKGENTNYSIDIYRIPAVTTTITNTNTNANAIKVIRDGQLFILRGGQVYTATGQKY